MVTKIVALELTLLVAWSLAQLPAEGGSAVSVVGLNAKGKRYHAATGNCSSPWMSRPVRHLREEGFAAKCRPGRCFSKRLIAIIASIGRAVDVEPPGLLELVGIVVR
jgi:hypothetical protein